MHLSDENIMGIKVIDLNTGMLIGEINLEDLIGKYGSPVPNTYINVKGKDTNSNSYKAITNGVNPLIQEVEDIYVSEDESFCIVCYVISSPKYFKFNLSWKSIF